MKDEDEVGQRVASMPSLIGWCSLCLFCAAWGPVVPAPIRSVWGYFGLFGLVAGFALDKLATARAHKEDLESFALNADRQITRLRLFCNAAAHRAGDAERGNKVGSHHVKQPRQQRTGVRTTETRYTDLADHTRAVSS